MKSTSLWRLWRLTESHQKSTVSRAKALPEGDNLATVLVADLNLDCIATALFVWFDTNTQVLHTERQCPPWRSLLILPNFHARRICVDLAVWPQHAKAHRHVARAGYARIAATENNECVDRFIDSHIVDRIDIYGLRGSTPPLLEDFCVRGKDNFCAKAANRFPVVRICEPVAPLINPLSS